jgi:hypothetical protein
MVKKKRHSIKNVQSKKALPSSWGDKSPAYTNAPDKSGRLSNVKPKETNEIAKLPPT